MKPRRATPASAVSFVALGLVLCAAASRGDTAPAGGPAQGLLDGEFQTTGTGLKWRELAPGAGAEVREGGTAMVHYTGWLTNGTKFDSSLDSGRPFAVRSVGTAPVIRGWNEGLLGMRAGGRRRLVIPPELAYGALGAAPVIPPNATLVFDVEVVSVEAPPPATPMPDLAAVAFEARPSGLGVSDVAAGGGAEARAGSTVDVHYTGWLADTGRKFDSSHDRGQAFRVENVGAARVIKGWNEGLVGMRAGGRRLLRIPPGLAYGEGGFPPLIPGGATLVFLVEAVSVEPGAAAR